MKVSSQQVDSREHSPGLQHWAKNPINKDYDRSKSPYISTEVDLCQIGLSDMEGVQIDITLCRIRIYCRLGERYIK